MFTEYLLCSKLYVYNREEKTKTVCAIKFGIQLIIRYTLILQIKKKELPIITHH